MVAMAISPSGKGNTAGYIDPDSLADLVLSTINGMCFATLSSGVLEALQLISGKHSRQLYRNDDA